MERNLLILILSTYLIVQISCQCLTPNDYEDSDRDGKKSLYTGQQEFSLNLLQAINQYNPTGNVFFSPYSTYHALLIAYFISAKQTEEHLRNALRLDPKQSKKSIFTAYKLDKLTSSYHRKGGTYEFSNANRIYVDRGVQVRDCMYNIFRDEIQEINFRGEPDSSRKAINSWVEEETHQMIKDLLPPTSVTPDTTLALVNAAYFKGLWENEFDENQTKPEVFYISPTKQTFVDMMHVEGTFNHDVRDSLVAHILELPYKGEDISMYILLPPWAKSDGIETILKNLTPERLKSIVEPNSLSPRTVQVSLPKFSLEHNIELVPILEKIGVGDLFQGSADLSTLAQNISLGEALHKAKIEVSEQGTKAAAATILFTFRSSRPIEPTVFNCNHPFVYIIYNKVENALLFTGVFRRPY